MIVATLALLSALQSQERAPLSLMPGTSQAFYADVSRVAKATQDGDWAEAQRLASRLPDWNLTIDWDESGLPAEKRAVFRRTLNSALKQWGESMEEISTELKVGGLLKFTFVPSLPPSVDSIGPAAAVHISSPDESEPAFEAVLAITRGEESVSTEPRDLKNEIMYAVGARFGLARIPKPPALMYRVDDQYRMENRLTFADHALIRRVVALCDGIRTDVAAKKPIIIAKPQIFISPLKLEPTPVNQAEEMTMTIQVSNRGTDTLDYRVIPDCSCFTVGPHIKSVKPGQTEVVPFQINTMDFVGHLQKAIYVYSNDPEMPLRRIAMETIVKPAYRFVDLYQGPSVIVEDSGAFFEMLLVIEDNVDMNITRAAVNGVSAGIEFNEWQGALPNPDIGEPERKRKGYKIRVLIAPDIPTGRASMSIRIDTDNDIFKTLYFSKLVQKGIVPVPMSIYFGEIDQGEARAYVVLSRPNRPFKILSVKSDVSYIKASVEPYSGDTNYKIVASYDGTGNFGRFFAKITVKTDDPKQPTIEIPIEGTIK